MATYAWPASFIETFGKYIRTRHFATTLQGRVKGWKGHKAQIQVGLFLGLVNPWQCGIPGQSGNYVSAPSFRFSPSIPAPAQRLASQRRPDSPSAQPHQTFSQLVAYPQPASRRWFNQGSLLVYHATAASSRTAARGASSGQNQHSLCSIYISYSMGIRASSLVHCLSPKMVPENCWLIALEMRGGDFSEGEMNMLL